MRGKVVSRRAVKVVRRKVVSRRAVKVVRRKVVSRKVEKVVRGKVVKRRVVRGSKHRHSPNWLLVLQQPPPNCLMAAFAASTHGPDVSANPR